MKRCSWVNVDNELMLEYHDREWGVPAHDDRKHFEFLVLEAAQAGLNWSIVLNKREGYRRAFSQFDPQKVARYTPARVGTLVLNPEIIRNRLKIEAAIANAKALLALRKSHGSFAEWLDAHHPRAKQDWLPLFKQTFRFTGGEIVGEFLLSTGYLPGAHRPGCPVYARVLRRKPAWAR